MGGMGKSAARAWHALGFVLVLAAALPAFSADYPRRIAIAPFSALSAQDDVKQTASILPRLLSSRLMALAGAEVVLLPPGDKPHEQAAREAGLPLLLQGAVSRLGKGYSIDAAATDLSSGRTAGAFFAAAATEDDIIPQLGAMASEIAEKLFGVKTAAPAAPPQPPAARPAPGAAGPLQAAVPQAAAPASPPAALPAPAPGTPSAPFVPAALKKTGQSDKIADELYGVVAGDEGPDGSREVVAWGKRILYFYKIKGASVVPFTRITKDVRHHVLNVESVDLDGDGSREILLTELVEEELQSHVLKRKGDVYEPVAGPLPYSLVVLPDWQGKRTVVGQRRGVEVPFQGKIVKMAWDGKTLAEGEPLPADTNILPLAAGIFGLSSAGFDSGSKLIYTDEQERLRILESSGKSEYKSKQTYGTAIDYFEWGLVQALEGRKKRFYLRKAARTIPGEEGKPFVLIPEVKKGVLNVTSGSYDSTRLVLLQWDGGEFMEKAATPKSDSFYSGADPLVPSGLARGSRIVASVVEQEAGIFKNPLSRLLLLEAE